MEFFPAVQSEPSSAFDHQMHQYRREFLLYASSQQPLRDKERKCQLLELRELELVQATVGMLLHSVRSKLQRIFR